MSHDQYPNETPHIVEVRSPMWTGAALRAAPRAYAKSCGQLDFGQYVCGVERDGFWLRLTMEDGTDGPDAHWVCVQDRDGKTLLEPVRDADMGNPSVPQEDALADKFDRPFEPRLQAPDFEKPEATGTGRNHTNLIQFDNVCPFRLSVFVWALAFAVAELDHAVRLDTISVFANWSRVINWASLFPALRKNKRRHQ